MVWQQVVIRYAPKVLTGVAGLVAADGVAKKRRAKHLSDEATAKYNKAVEVAEQSVAETNARADGYGRQQLQAKVEVVGRFADFLERNATEVARSNIDLLDGFDVRIGTVASYRELSVEAVDVLNTTQRSVRAAVMAYRGAVSAATRIGVAGTGAPIAGLHGAAARNATLAYIGGGPVSAGGGGMAAGKAVLQGLGFGSAAAVAAFSFHTHQEKQLTAAERYHAQVEEYGARLQLFRTELGAIRRRTGELSRVLKQLCDRATAILDELESQPFDAERDQALLEQALMMVKGVVEVAKTPVLTEEGDLNKKTAKIVTRYKKELADDVVHQ